MRKRTKVALYPIYSDTLPVARYLLNYRSDFEIVELLSPAGVGAVFKDASILDNRETLGIQVKPYREANFRSLDELYLLQHETLGLSEESRDDSLYSQIIKMAQNSGCRIVNYPYSMDNLIVTKGYINEKNNVHVDAMQGLASPKQIKAFVILVIGAVPEVNAFEVALNLYGELKREHEGIIAFSSSKNAAVCDMFSLYNLLYDPRILNEQKVFAIANEISKVHKENNADIILLHLNEATIAFNDTQTFGFGIVPYLVSQVFLPDYCICCLPYGYSNPSFLKEFEQKLEGCFGFTPDHWHLSNSMIDFTTISSPRGIGTVHVPVSDVVHTLQNFQDNGIDIGCDILPDYLNKTIEKIMIEYTESQLITSIL